MKTETKTKKQTPKARITSIAVSRLYNLGNYQNVKYDLAADVPSGVSAKKILLQLTRTLGLLKPIKEPYCLHDFENTIKKSKKDLSDLEKKNLENWTELVTTYKKRLAAREKALLDLDSLGGTSIEKDAKEDWEDTPEPW